MYRDTDNSCARIAKSILVVRFGHFTDMYRNMAQTLF